MKKMFIYLLLIFSFTTPYLAYSDKVILGGDNIGIQVNTKGVLVVGKYKVNNKLINEDNISIGDYIIKIEDNDINTIDDFRNLINKYIKNDSINITINRDGNEINTKLNLIEKNGEFKSGLYIKNSLTGIGTITYIDPFTKIYGALGHEITESNTEKIIDIDNGKIYDSEVTSITKSRNGEPGSKNANINFDDVIGSVEINTTKGIFGYYDNENNNELYDVASFDEIKKGDAYIYTVTDKKDIKKYKIKITKLYKDRIDSSKSIAFTIDDKDLLKETGGIIQGMSGSPIVQDNKIIGAVTNVIVDRVNKGYGIYIKTMLETGDSLIED